MQRRVVLLVAASLGFGCGGHNSGPKTQAQGSAERTETSALEAGATLQSAAPVKQLESIWSASIPMKDDPSVQMEAHHYCNQVNEDFAQCVLFDGNTTNANMNGVEYIISETLFNGLPEAEKKYWHPHNYEILSGELVGPGSPKSRKRTS